jgi:uncharacterized protein (DUF2267 family)
MDADAFVDRTRARLGADDRDEAAEAVHATLWTLGEQLSPEQADDLAARLPDGIHDHLRQGSVGDPEGLGTESFYTKVGRRQSPQAEADYARAQVQAVLAVLAEAVDAAALHRATAQLSTDYRELLPMPDEARPGEG